MMKHLKWWYAIGLLAVILLVGFIASTQNVGASISPHQPTHPYHAVNRAKAKDVSSTYVPGAPAISAHVSAGMNAVATTKTTTDYTNTSLTPAFTASDVIAYLNKDNGAGFTGPLAPGAHLKIVTIQFVTAKQAFTLTKGESIGRPDDYLVCYVKIQGPFQTTNMMLPPEAKAIPTVATNYAVFDGHTGNLLVYGTN